MKGLLRHGGLRGYRTYLLAVVAIVSAVAGYLIGELSLYEALEAAWAGGVAAALRAGIQAVPDTRRVYVDHADP